MTSGEDNPKRVYKLLEEFARRHYAGEAPDPLDFVRRAGEEGTRMRELIALFLAESEPVLPSPAAARDLIERYAPKEERESDVLLEEFARRHYAGEVPDPLDFVRRAGEEGTRMRELIALFLAESEPVLPSPAAARDLIERYAPKEELIAVEEDAGAEGSKLLRELFDHWLAATVQAREALADRIAGAASPGLRLEPSGHRGAAAEVDELDAIVQLNRPQGGKAMVSDSVLVVVLYGMPEEFVGTQPLLAFPNAGQAEAVDVEWAETAERLPPGLVRTDVPIGKRRELQATVGRLRGPGSLDLMLTGLRILQDRERGR